MNPDDDFDLDDYDLCLRPWGESRVRLFLAGLVQALSLAFVWAYVSDVWQLVRTVSLSSEIPDDWHF